MSWDVDVEPVGNLPTPTEMVSAFCNCPGNMYVCVMDLTGKQLRDMQSEEAIDSLVRVIAELDKGNDGMFNDAYAVDADKKWSNGRESTTNWKEVEDFLVRFPKHKFPFTDYKSFCGHEMRRRCREHALQFFFYYKCGYKVTFSW